MARSFEIFWPRTPQGMAEAEWQARLQLAACYRLVDHYGWTSVVYNHITLRIPGTDHFLINCLEDHFLEFWGCQNHGSYRLLFWGVSWAI